MDVYTESFFCANDINTISVMQLTPPGVHSALRAVSV